MTASLESVLWIDCILQLAYAIVILYPGDELGCEIGLFAVGDVELVGVIEDNFLI